VGACSVGSRIQSSQWSEAGSSYTRSSHSTGYGLEVVLTPDPRTCSWQAAVKVEGNGGGMLAGTVFIRASIRLEFDLAKKIAMQLEHTSKIVKYLAGGGEGGGERRRHAPWDIIYILDPINTVLTLLAGGGEGGGERRGHARRHRHARLLVVRRVHHQGRSHEAKEGAPRRARQGLSPQEKEFVIDNLLVRNHFIIVMIRWTGLAPWEFEFPFPGSLTSTFLVPLRYHFWMLLDL